MKNNDTTMKHLDEMNLFYTNEESGPTRDKIALDTLARYSGTAVEEFQPYILLTNFPYYVDMFADLMGVQAVQGSVIKVAHAPEAEMSIVDYRVGAPMAALIVDVLSYCMPEVLLMLGLCGGLHVSQAVGDLLIPMAAIRDEGVSRHYMPAQVPSLPAFMVQQLISEELLEQNCKFRTGVLHTTDYRMWEFNDEFKTRLRKEKATAIDMECSALFTAGFARKVPVGALMLISDLPLQPRGIKTKESARKVFKQFSTQHLQLGIDSIKRMQEANKSGKLNLRRFHF